MMAQQRDTAPRSLRLQPMARPIRRGDPRSRSGLLRRWPASCPRGALLLSALTFASYVMGLVRDRTFARTFGAGSELDVYNAALVLPELALDVLVVAGLSSAFVPVFARLGTRTPRPPRTSRARC